MENALVPYSDLEAMAAQVVKSKMFPGISTPEAAMTLFLLCQSEGLHPMQALTRYHVIQGRPAMKADAMLAEFMRRGGTVHWSEYGDEKVTAVFTSQGCPAGVSVTWTLADAKRAGLTSNPTWTKYPRQMLKARVASDGVRMADPAVNQGRWTPEEHESFEPVPKVVPAEIVAPEPLEERDVANRREVLVIEANEADPQGISFRTKYTEPTGPSTLERQLAKSLGESPEPLGNVAAPGHCTLKGCQGEVDLYVSTSKAFPGREYWQCASAHEEKVRLLNEGATNKLANAAVAAHYREWVGPWMGFSEARMLAGEASAEAGRTRPWSEVKEELAAGEQPSIFDPVKISKDVARKLAAEAK